MFTGCVLWAFYCISMSHVHVYGTQLLLQQYDPIPFKVMHGGRVDERQGSLYPSTFVRAKPCHVFPTTSDTAPSFILDKSLNRLMHDDSHAGAPERLNPFRPPSHSATGDDTAFASNGGGAVVVVVAVAVAAAVFLERTPAIVVAAFTLGEVEWQSSRRDCLCRRKSILHGGATRSGGG